MRALCAALTGALLAAGCSSQPKLLRHYGELVSPRLAPEPLALSVFPANPKSAQQEPLILALGARAQSELIRSLAARLPEKGGANELLTLLSEPTQGAPIPCAWANRTSMTKQLVFTVLGDLDKPADRIEKLDFRLALPEKEKTPQAYASAAQFQSWDHFTPVYVDYTIGTAKSTQSTKLTAGTSRSGTANLADAAGSVVKVFDFGYESDKSLEESAAYALQRLYVGGALTPATAQLVQERGPHQTLFGSSAATITFSLTSQPEPSPAYAFTLKRGDKIAAPAEVRVERCLSRFPHSSEPIVAKVTGTALVREVLAGDGTVPEGDDKVSMRVVNLISKSDVVLASTSELAVDRYGLAVCKPGNQVDDCLQLHIEVNRVRARSIELVLLGTLGDAAALRDWLVVHSRAKKIVPSIGNLAIGMAPQESSGDSKTVPLKGINASTAAILQVVILGGNAPLPTASKDIAK